MPRRELLTSAQREALLAFPREEGDLLRHFVGVAAITTGWGLRVQLCYLRFPSAARS